MPNQARFRFEYDRAVIRLRSTTPDERTYQANGGRLPIPTVGMSPSHLKLLDQESGEGIATI
jgi:hypothetical protein